DDAAWTADLAWIRDTYPNMRGTPWFFLGSGRTIEAAANSTDLWRMKFAPLAAEGSAPMRRVSRALCCIAALSAAGSWAAGAAPDRQNIIIDNVVVELSATPEGVTACVDAVHGTKLSGP